jgi:hypothetical protein
MRFILTVVLCCWALGASGQEQIVPPEPIVSDFTQCKTAATRAGNWDRDGWDARTVTGGYLVLCMRAKGYRLGCSGDTTNFNIEIEACWQK